MKYINADKLIAEVERRKEKWLAESRLIRKGKDKAMYAAGKSSGYTEFLSLIDSLQQEQPKVADASKMEQPVEGMEELRKEVIKMLKSLRPSWKPSEEQMRFLLAVINEPNNAGSESCHIILNSLYHDLQNLH